MNLNSYIDHTVLKPDATKEQIEKLCEEAREYQFATVAINGSRVKEAAALLEGSGVGISACVGFPLGAMTSETKAFEAKQAVENGATEIDMVINIGRLKDGDEDYVCDDISAVVEAVSPVPVKVILETCLLSDEEKVLACKCALTAGAAFVKTSTGFSTGGATVSDVELMKKTVGDECKIKASGGVKTREDALAMIEAGASRIGTSAGVAICKDA